MTGPTTHLSPLPPAPDRRPTARLAGTLILASLTLGLAQSFLFDAPEPVPSLVGIASAVAMTIAVLGLARLRAAGSGWVAQVALVLWAVSALLQAVIVFNIQGDGSGAAVWPWRLVTAAWLTTLVAGLILAGVGIVRAGVLTGWRRWVPLAFGITYVLGMVPPVLGIYGLIAFVGLPVIALHVLLGVALLTAFRGDATKSEWARSSAVLETP